MKIYYNLEPNEKMTNFRVAEAVIDLCTTEYGLDAETVAKMILLQVDAMKDGAE